MTVRMAYDNLGDDASAISASSEASGFPVENVQSTLLGKTWRTTGVQVNEYITLDLGSVQNVSCAIIAAHDLTVSDSLIQVRKSNDNFSADDNLVASFTHNAGIMIVWFTQTSERYWRIRFTKSAAAQIRNIGRIFLGTYFEPSRAQGLNNSRQHHDPSIVSRAVSGAVYSDQRDKYHIIECSFMGWDSSDISTFRTMIDTVGKAIPIFLSLDVVNEPNDLTHYGRFSDIPPEIQITQLPNYQIDMRFEEEV